MQLDIDPFEYGIQVTCNLRVPESDDAVSFFFKPELPLTVAPSDFVLIMMSAIELNDQMGGRAEEIDDIWANRCLTPEVRSLRGKSFQRTPQRTLMRSGAGSQSFRRCAPDRRGNHKHLTCG
jgi:hypothetical protein